MQRTLSGTGLGLRPPLVPALLRAPRAVDFVEVVAESLHDPGALREAVAVREIWPVVPHGVKLSLGSAEGIDRERARFLGRVARALRAPVVSEHLAFVRAGGREIGHLTEVPRTREAVRVIARNVTALRRELPDVPLLLENVASGFVWPAHAHAMTEGDFLYEVARATGCALLLDVGNLYANARNAGDDPRVLLGQAPLDDVAMVHVAGGAWEDGFYADTHAHPVPADVIALVGDVLARRNVAVLLERDAAFEPTNAIFDEVRQLRALARGAVDARAEKEEARAEAGGEAGAGAEAEVLADAQALLAARLVGDAMDANDAVARARRVLARKRGEAALALLPHLRAVLDASTAARIADLARAPRVAFTAAADARRIADAAASLAPFAAAIDALTLRARFARDPRDPRPRIAPFVGRATSPHGTLWALKGPGKSAHVRTVARQAPPLIPTTVHEIGDDAP